VPINKIFFKKIPPAVVAVFSIPYFRVLENGGYHQNARAFGALPLYARLPRAQKETPYFLKFTKSHPAIIPHFFVSTSFLPQPPNPEKPRLARSAGGHTMNPADLHRTGIQKGGYDHAYKKSGSFQPGQGPAGGSL
jgi:hypothetical protein